MKEPKEVSGILLNDEELDGVVGGVEINKSRIELDSPSNIVRPLLNPSVAVEISGHTNGCSLSIAGRAPLDSGCKTEPIESDLSDLFYNTARPRDL